MTEKSAINKKENPTRQDYNSVVDAYQGLETKVNLLIEKKAAEEKDASNAGIHLIENNKEAVIQKGHADYNQGLGPIVRTGYSHSSDEAKCYTAYGVNPGDVPKLLKVNVADPKFKFVDPALAYRVLKLKTDLDVARGIAQMFYGDRYDHIGATAKQDRTGSCSNLLESRFAKDVLVPQIKAFVTGTALAGGNWIPTMIADSFIQEFELSRRLIGELVSVTMPTSPFEQPTMTNLQTARRGTENVTATDSTFDTPKITYTAQKFLEYVILSEEVTEDTAPNILEAARQQLGIAHERAFETSVLNGTDSGSTHIDTDTEAGAADLAEKQYDGLRRKALVNTANGGTVDFANGVVTDAKLREMRTNLGDMGVNPDDCLWIMGAIAYQQAQGTDNVVTLDKLGPRATVISGHLTAYAGIPIITSGFLRSDLNATGVNDGITADRTGLLIIHKKRWYFATRRPVRMAIRPARSADDRFEMASYSRVDFQGHPQSADEVGVVYGFNVST